MSTLININFFVDNAPIYTKTIEQTLKLSEIRKNLNIKDEYIFQTKDGIDISIEDEIYYILKDSLIDNDKILLKQIKKNIPINGFKKIYIENNLDIYLYPSDKLTKEEEENAIVLMFVGETWSGKTTLINAYINYILGINYVDDFRYKIINQKFNKDNDQSQTNEIGIYNIKAPDGTILKIIDTPGFVFGDICDIKKNKEITQKIKEYVFDKLSSINCICFVIQAYYSRFYENRKYGFNHIVDLFGDDVKSNFIFMFSYCDSCEPRFLRYLKDKDYIFHEIVPYIENPWYFQFNNASVFVKDINNRLNECFFKLGKKSFKDFTEKIKKLNKVSLSKSKEVLKERFNLEKQVGILQPLLKEGIDKVNYIKELITKIKKLKLDLKWSKNFSRTIKELRMKRVDRSINNCLVCHHSCHDSCNCKDDEMYNCTTMTGDKTNARCNVCKGKCHWTHHKNMPYIYVEEEVEVTFVDLKTKYYDSKNEFEINIKLIQEAKKELIEINQKWLDIQGLITKSINRLNEIALNKNVFATSEEDIEYLIYYEQDQKRPGYQTRIETLKILKNQKKILREIYECKNNQLLNIKRFINKFLENEKKIYDINETNFEMF